MDNCLQSIDLIPGREGKNAILAGWVDAIKKHDEVVTQVEEWMDVVDAKKAVFLEQDRIYKNHSIAWRQLNDDPDEYHKYLDSWKPAYRDVSIAIAVVIAS